MNKELIKKYKKEFDYWLEGGEILKASWDFDSNELSCWYHVKHDSDWNFLNIYEYKFIINDEYVELRKAQAEGKQNRLLTHTNIWIDIDNILDKFPVELHRIKPKEL